MKITAILLSCLQTARLYDTERNSSRAMYVHGAPVLDCTFQENDRAILTAGLNCQIKW